MVVIVMWKIDEEERMKGAARHEFPHDEERDEEEGLRSEHVYEDARCLRIAMQIDSFHKSVAK